MRFPSLIPPRAMNVLELWGKELTDNYFNTLQKTIGGNTGATAHEWQTVLGRCDPGLLAAEGASLTPLLFCTKVIPTILLCFVTCQAHRGRQTPVSDRIIVNNIYDLITDICWQSFIMSRSGSGLAGTEGSTNSIRWDLQCWNIFHDDPGYLNTIKQKFFIVYMHIFCLFVYISYNNPQLVKVLNVFI